MALKLKPGSLKEQQRVGRPGQRGFFGPGYYSPLSAQEAPRSEAKEPKMAEETKKSGKGKGKGKGGKGKTKNTKGQKPRKTAKAAKGVSGAEKKKEPTAAQKAAWKKRSQEMKGKPFGSNAKDKKVPKPAKKTAKRAAPKKASEGKGAKSPKKSAARKAAPKERAPMAEKKAQKTERRGKSPAAKKAEHKHELQLASKRGKNAGIKIGEKEGRSAGRDAVIRRLAGAQRKPTLDDALVVKSGESALYSAGAAGLLAYGVEANEDTVKGWFGDLGAKAPGTVKRAVVPVLGAIGMYLLAAWLRSPAVAETVPGLVGSAAAELGTTYAKTSKAGKGSFVDVTAGYDDD